MFLNDTNSEKKDGIKVIWYHSVERSFKIAILSKQLVINISLTKTRLRVDKDKPKGWFKGNWKGDVHHDFRT